MGAVTLEATTMAKSEKKPGGMGGKRTGAKKATKKTAKKR